MNSARKNAMSFYSFVSKNLNSFVELKTYLSGEKLYGQITEADKISLTLSINYIDDKTHDLRQSTRLYIPLNSIISIRVL